MEPGYRQIEHTADLALELFGPEEVDVLRAGLRAVVAVLTEEAAIAPSAERIVELQAVDPADRLVRWLNEILYMASVEGFVATDAEIELRPGGLRAVVHGEPDARDRLRTEIKSATYHDVELGPVTEGWRARVVLDV